MKKNHVNLVGILREGNEGEFVYNHFNYAMTTESVQHYSFRAKEIAYTSTGVTITTDDNTILTFVGHDTSDLAADGISSEMWVTSLTVSRPEFIDE